MKTKSVFSIITLAAGLQFATAGDITGVITLKGTPPPEVPNTYVMDEPTCGKLHTTTPTSHHYIVGANGGLANVVVQLKGNGINGKSTGASATPVVMDQKGCLYEPQILAVQTGQKVMIKNSDPVAHNVHVNPTASENNQPNNSPTQMPNAADVAMTFSKPEIFMKFQCDSHTWMFAWVTVVDSPYYALTGKDGKFTIKDVPPGEYTIVALHRKVAPTGVEQKVTVTADGGKADFTLEVK